MLVLIISQYDSVGTLVSKNVFLNIKASKFNASGYVKITICIVLQLMHTKTVLFITMVFRKMPRNSAF